MTKLATVLPLALALTCLLASAQIIDYHQHLYSPAAGARSSPGPKGIPVSTRMAGPDSAGIQRAVVLSVAHSFANPNKPNDPNEYADVRAENDSTSAQVAKYPESTPGSAALPAPFCREVGISEKCFRDNPLKSTSDG